MKCTLPLPVLKQHIFLFIDTVKSKVFSVCFQTFILGMVINNNHEVVSVVLGENRVQVMLNAKSIIIIIPRNYEAHRQLFGDFIKPKFFIQSHPILLIGHYSIPQVSSVKRVVELGQMDGRIKDVFILVDVLVTVNVKIFP